jgi:hypothetical protein
MFEYWIFSGYWSLDFGALPKRLPLPSWVNRPMTQPLTAKPREIASDAATANLNYGSCVVVTVLGSRIAIGWFNQSGCV